MPVVINRLFSSGQDGFYIRRCQEQTLLPIRSVRKPGGGNLGLGPCMLKVVSVLCFVVLLVVGCAYSVGLAFLRLSSRVPISGALIWVAMVISFSFYFRYPWIVAVVSWIDFVRALKETNTSELTSIGGIFFNLALNIVFLLAAHAGLISWILQRRITRRPPRGGG